MEGIATHSKLDIHGPSQTLTEGYSQRQVAHAPNIKKLIKQDLTGFGEVAIGANETPLNLAAAIGF